MVIVNDRALVDKVGNGESVISCLLSKLACLSAEATVGVRMSHGKVWLVEAVVCSAVGSCEWGLRF